MNLRVLGSNPTLGEPFLEFDLRKISLISWLLSLQHLNFRCLSPGLKCFSPHLMSLKQRNLYDNLTCERLRERILTPSVLESSFRSHAYENETNAQNDKFEFPW